MSKVFTKIGTIVALVLVNLVFFGRSKGQEEIGNIKKNAKDIKSIEGANCTGTGGI